MTRLLPLLALLTVSAAHAAPCPVIEPGKALGAYQIGAPQKALGALKALPGDNMDGDLVQPAGAKHTRLRVKDRAVIEAEIPVPACAVIGGATYTIASPYHLAALLGTCEARQINQEYDTLECLGARIVLDSKPSVQVYGAKAVTTGGGCATYLFDDRRVDAAGITTLKGPFTLKPATKVCADQLAFGPGSTPQALEDGVAECKKTANRGGTHFTCGRYTFSFAGPKLTPSRVSFK